MEDKIGLQGLEVAVLRESERLLTEERQEIYRRTDALFASLMIFQWCACVGAALWLSPLTWAGQYSRPHIHIFAAIFLGGAIAAFPVYLASVRPGAPLTRYTISAAQLMISALLIHLSGGRIETHFHIFGSLAFLAFYRDWRVLIPATIVATLDHLLRGAFWPQSIFGVAEVSHWRWLEHAGWVVFEDIFLSLSCLQSVTDLRKMARQRAQLELSNQIVERKVADRTAELSVSQSALRLAKDSAEAASRAKSTFLAAMSHEIRTPMNGILGMTEVVLLTELNEDQRENLSLVKLSAESLLSIVGDILDFTKIEAGKLELEIRPFDLRKSVRDALRTVQIRAKEKNIHLEMQVAPEIPEMIGGDDTRLRQILLNLIGNAIKFTRIGGVDVSVSVASQTGPCCTLQFAVKDTGLGIPLEQQGKIFQAFTQADESMSRRYGGTGLGLTISSRLVEAMNGRIWVESVPGEGSTFLFTAEFVAFSELPSSKFAQHPAPEEISVESGLKILVAEDNLVNQKLARRLLEKRGHSVTVVADGKQAVNAFESQAFDIILMDIQMPEMDGHEAARAIRELERNRASRVPIIALTAHAMKDDEEKCLASGMDSYVTKPIRPAELFSAISHSLGNRQAISVN